MEAGQVFLWNMPISWKDNKEVNLVIATLLPNSGLYLLTKSLLVLYSLWKSPVFFVSKDTFISNNACKETPWIFQRM